MPVETLLKDVQTKLPLSTLDLVVFGHGELRLTRHGLFADQFVDAVLVTRLHVVRLPYETRATLVKNFES